MTGFSEQSGEFQVFRGEAERITGKWMYAEYDTFRRVYKRWLKKEKRPTKWAKNPNLLVLSFRFNGLQDHEYSPYDKDGKRDEEDHTEPIHLLMERLYE